MKTSPAISARQPTAHAQRGRRAEFNAQKDLRSEKEQQPPECVSLWKTGKERELSTSVKETHAFPNNLSHYGLTGIDPEWESGEMNTSSDSATCVTLGIFLCFVS